MTFQPASQRDLVHLMENREKASTEAFSELLDEIIQLNGCGWELGPDPIDPTRDILAFSILGDKANIDRIAEEMNLPIVHSEWSAIAGIPPRIWKRNFRYTDNNGQNYDINGSSWRYKIVDKDLGIEFIFHPFPEIHEDYFEEFSTIICVGEIGEKNISDFVISISCGNFERNEGKVLSFLRDDFVHRFPACHYASVFGSDDDNSSK